MAFNIFSTQRVSRFGQYDRIDDLITCKLRGDKCSVFRQFLVDEFHVSAICKCLDPLFVWQFGTSSAEVSVSLVCAIRCQKSHRDGHEQASQRTIASRMIRLEEPPHGKFAKFNDQ